MMSSLSKDFAEHLQLRARAVAKLNAGFNAARVPPTSAPALGVLHGMAMSPATASDAMALLHELQVHQVELELQRDELCTEREELEASLQRQQQLYEHATVGLCTIDRQSQVLEMNLATARLLGIDRDASIGMQLSSLLAPADAAEFIARLLRIDELSALQEWTVDFRHSEQAKPRLRLVAQRDPASTHYLIALSPDRA